MEKKLRDQFKREVLLFYEKHGRKDLPWRKDINPYRVLVSEFMLQQTQVDRVLPHFVSWMEKFPTLDSLADVSQREILSLWSGLGYNRRAIFLYRTIQIILKKFSGEIPKEKEALTQLPGIGEYTAGAIRNFAFNEWTTFIDTNIRRVFIHHFFQEKNIVSDREILSLMEEISYGKSPRIWGYALMDYGSYLRGQNGENPNRKSKHYVKQSPFLYSRRYWRSKIIKLLLRHNHLNEKKLFRLTQEEERKLSYKDFEEIMTRLSEEGFIIKKAQSFSLKE